MLITFKTLQQQSFKIEVSEDDLVKFFSFLFFLPLLMSEIMIYAKIWRRRTTRRPFCLSYDNDLQINRLGIKDRLDECL